MPLYIAKSGDLEGCHACLTDRLTTLKDRATQLLIKYKIGALVTQYKAQTKCKTRFHSQGMILNGFYKNHFSKQVCGTRDPLETPPPFMANAILNFHFDFLNP